MKLKNEVGHKFSYMQSTDYFKINSLNNQKAHVSDAVKFWNILRITYETQSTQQSNQAHY